MSKPNGNFIDANNIIIINDVPYFSIKGSSYLEKLKNGLSLDFVFLMEDSAVKPEEKFEENLSSVKEEKQYQPLKYKLFAEEYDYEPFSMPRKGKNIIKKPSGKNMKKNKIKQNGYDDKLHNIEVNLPTIDYHKPIYNNYYNSNINHYHIYHNGQIWLTFTDHQEFLDYCERLGINCPPSYDSLDDSDYSITSYDDLDGWTMEWI